MTHAVPNGSPPRSDRSHHTLELVAATLGCTVDALLTGEGLPTELTQTDELLRLWGLLKTDGQRDRVLRIVLEAVASPEQ